MNPQAPRDLKVSYLTSTTGHSPNRWRSAPDPGARIIQMPDLAAIQQTLLSARSTRDVERVIVDSGVSAGEFLAFLATLPGDFKADVLFIETGSRAFLSAAGPEGRRVLYSMDRDDLDFYCRVFALRDDPTLNVASACSAAGRLLKVRVLVAEDERRTRELMLSLLQDLGCEPIVAATGLEAIRLTNEHRPQVVFLDGLMPEMHGFEVARIIRTFDTNYRPRIVMLTGVYKGLNYRNDAKLRYGVDGYLVKPVSREEIASAIFDQQGTWALAATPPLVKASTGS